MGFLSREGRLEGKREPCMFNLYLSLGAFYLSLQDFIRTHLCPYPDGREEEVAGNLFVFHFFMLCLFYG